MVRFLTDVFKGFTQMHHLYSRSPSAFLLTVISVPRYQLGTRVTLGAHRSIQLRGSQVGSDDSERADSGF